jgi:AAA15 family ATPase/GTPase
VRIQDNVNDLLTIYTNNPEGLKDLNKELRRLDVGLDAMLIESGAQGFFAKFQHVGLDDFILFAEESAGTQRFIEIFHHLFYVLQTGGIALIDEIDSDLHPLLLPELFKWFNDPKRNPCGAQLFFTAHNPTLLDNLEKEQVFFTEKPIGQSTRVYGAREFKGLRRKRSLMKKYLLGELGAVPHIRSRFFLAVEGIGDQAFIK